VGGDVLPLGKQELSDQNDGGKRETSLEVRGGPLENVSVHI